VSNWSSAKARKVYRALLRIGWTPRPSEGSSHVQLTHPEKGTYTWGFHDSEEIGPKMLARIAKPDTYSCLSAAMGSTLAARRAGIQEASNATPVRTRDTATNVRGSVGLTP
jgi:predicted RNA binding protein YcfA (HicA-like mRNA interferase family)